MSAPALRLAARSVAGTGTPVVLVPGFTGSKEDFLELLGPLAATGRPITAVDLPGQLDSPGADDPAAYAVDALGGDVLAVLHAVGSPVHLAGHSFGGLVARAVAIREPAALRSLTLLGSGPAALGGRRAERIRRLRPVLAAGGLAAVWQASQALEAAEPGYVAPPPPVAAFLQRRFLASNPVGLAAMGEALLAEPDRVDALRGTGVPVLVAHGTDDDAWPPEVQREMAERLGAAYAVIPDAGHSPAAENPAGTAAVLIRFLAATEA